MINGDCDRSSDFRVLFVSFKLLLFLSLGSFVINLSFFLLISKSSFYTLRIPLHLHFASPLFLLLLLSSPWPFSYYLNNLTLSFQPPPPLTLPSPSLPFFCCPSSSSSLVLFYLLLILLLFFFFLFLLIILLSLLRPSLSSVVLLRPPPLLHLISTGFLNYYQPIEDPW